MASVALPSGGPGSATARGGRCGGGVLPLRRHGRLGGVPGPVCPPGRGRSSHTGMSVNREVYAILARGPRRAEESYSHGVDEPDGRLVPPHRGAQQPDAHRRGEHLRGSRAAVRAPRGDGLGKLDAVPRYRQKVRFVPLALGRPVWVDDPHFNLAYHLRHSALPAPGQRRGLRRTAARIFAQQLDRRKPLWEIWMIEGLSEGRWALLSKVHHCMVDGVSATDLMTVMFDDAPGGDRRRTLGSRRLSRATPNCFCARSRIRRSTRPSRCGWCGRRCAGRERRSPRAWRPCARWSRPAEY